MEEAWRTGIRGTEGLQRRHRAPTVQLSLCRPPMAEATLRNGKCTAFRVGPQRLPYQLYDLQVPPRLRAAFLTSTWGARHTSQSYRGEDWPWRPGCVPGVPSSTWHSPLCPHLSRSVDILHRKAARLQFPLELGELVLGGRQREQQNTQEGTPQGDSHFLYPRTIHKNIQVKNGHLRPLVGKSLKEKQSSHQYEKNPKQFTYFFFH